MLRRGGAMRDDTAFRWLYVVLRRYADVVITGRRYARYALCAILMRRRVTLLRLRDV